MCELNDLVMASLRERYPKGCDKCEQGLVDAAFRGADNPALFYCSACLVQYSDQEVIRTEIVRRFVKRRGGAA